MRCVESNSSSCPENQLRNVQPFNVSSDQAELNMCRSSVQWTRGGFRMNSTHEGRKESSEVYVRFASAIIVGSNHFILLLSFSNVTLTSRVLPIPYKHAIHRWPQ